MTMIRSLIRFGKRQLHTIVSTEIIKPSFPTPSHLKTYNLSLADRFVPSAFIPLITFYPNIDTYHSPLDQIIALKNSLSQTLTKYYPFAGRHARIEPTYVDCNDHGAEFVEAYVDSTLSHFLKNSQHEDLDQFFPYGRVWRYSNPGAHDIQTDTVIPLVVKVNHFECGGVAVAVSLSHKIADACSMIHFLKDWAKLTRVCSKNEKYEDVPIEPHFISFENTNIKVPEFSLGVSKDCVTRSFIFPNAKLNELKHKVTAMTARSEQHITNPTRVEVLTWLVYKCAVAAATKNNSGSFKPSSIGFSTNIREKLMEPLPDNCIGNYLMGLVFQTKNAMDLKPELLIGELRKQKMGIKRLKNLEAFLSLFLNFNLGEGERKNKNAYICSSICGYPAYGIDFGWGAPIKATIPGRLWSNSFVMMDAPNKEGIEVLVSLEKQEMDIIQRDPELLAFC
ncbi:putative deacetylvindoline O-acetyltransferase [Helianthus annuus]|nr:putative deacetylvindoline O-acetyltransferase [Helianthus annuus]